MQSDTPAASSALVALPQEPATVTQLPPTDLGYSGRISRGYPLQLAHSRACLRDAAELEVRPHSSVLGIREEEEVGRREAAPNPASR